MLTLELTEDEALSFVCGPVVEGRDIRQAGEIAQDKVWAAVLGEQEENPE